MKTVLGLAHPDHAIKKPTYAWGVKLMSLLEKRLKLRMKVHHEQEWLECGEIFLFNHFARFETAIPPYILFKETGAYCRTVAAYELFKNERLGRFLRSMGAVPNNHPSLLLFLASEIIKGAKVVIFPEGSMIKDRKVLDHLGRFRIFSQGQQRAHHSGAAALALTLVLLRQKLKMLCKQEERKTLAQWAHLLEVPSVEDLVRAASKPTTLVPSCMTFYPLRSSSGDSERENASRFAEEWLVESSLLLKNTDMDVRFSPPLSLPQGYWSWVEQGLLTSWLARCVTTPEDIFSQKPRTGLLNRASSFILSRNIQRLRDLYTPLIYHNTTIHVGHVLGHLLLQLAREGQWTLPRARVHLITYLTIKHLQTAPGVHRHRTVKDPERYGPLLRPGAPFQLLQDLVAAGTLEEKDDHYVLSPELLTYDPQNVRLHNPLAIYANESAPVKEVASAVEKACQRVERLSPLTLAEMRFDDQVITYRRDQKLFTGESYLAINSKETRTEEGGPHFLDAGPEKGVLLVHGLLASPAEVLPFARDLHEAGYTVLCVRLKGHGTSPWDLRRCSRHEWLASVREGAEILSSYVSRIFYIGFSTGGALSLLLAREKAPQAVVSISSPIFFRNLALKFVPLLHGLNKVTSWLPSLEGIMPFKENTSEHPSINYRHIPVRALYELGQMVDSLKEALPRIQVPTLVVHGTDDGVIDPKSASYIHNALGSARKALHWVESQKHGILYDNIGDTRSSILSFLKTLDF